MLDMHFLLINIVTILLFAMSIEYEGKHVYWNIIMSFISWVLFLFLTATSTAIEIPYQMFNATSGNIETGYQTYYTGYLMLVYFGLFVADFMYFLDLILHKELVKLFIKWKGHYP